MKKLLLGFALLSSTGLSIKLSACPILKQVACGAEADLCAAATGTVNGSLNYGTAWNQCYNNCCNS